MNVNPGTFWSVGTGSTLDHTLVETSQRAHQSSKFWTLTPMTNGQAIPNNTIRFLGSHSSSCEPSYLLRI
ncbi:MAG: hypothetical protein IPP71_24035 [Bacteroidetes bacterium]|nr:hypothetical protein [Bacteroidota bacterium]